MVYLWDGSAWVQRGDTMYGAGDGDWFGGSIALSRNGSTIAIGSIAYLGYTRVYDWSGSEWVQRARLGNSRISLSKDTNTLTIGSRLNDGANGVDSGHVRVFDWDGNAWSQRGADIDGEAAGGQFGRSVSMSANGNIVAAGARNYDANGLELAGHV